MGEGTSVRRVAESDDRRVCGASTGCRERVVFECVRCGEGFCADCVGAPHLARDHEQGRCLDELYRTPGVDEGDRG